MDTLRAFEAFAPLLEYPKAGYHKLTEACGAVLSGREAYPEPAGSSVNEHFAAFAAGVAPLSVGDLEELYTRTFDLNPTCSLDIGWHLYGEQYARGNFLVDMRDALRRHSIEESSELPDHLPSVLRLVARSEESASLDLMSASVRPALSKMLTAFPDDQNPYGSLLRSVDGLMGALCPQESGEKDHD